MKPIVALDFDGVICNSIDECMITACNSYHMFQGSSTWVDDVSELEQRFKDRFRKLRYLVKPAKEYWLLVNWIYTHLEDLKQSEFNVLKNDYKKKMEKYEPFFFKARHLLRLKDEEKWLRFHSLFPEFTAGWNVVRNYCDVFIVTTKDKLSVQYLIQMWKLAIDSEHILAKECGLSKASLIEQIAKQRNYKIKNIFFIDDHLDYLIEVLKVGARCFWASWGYTPTSKVFFEKNIYTLTTLSELPIHEF